MTIVNIMTIIKAAIALFLFIHVSSCLWILLAMNNPDSWLFTAPELTNHIHIGYYGHGETADDLGDLEERLDD